MEDNLGRNIDKPGLDAQQLKSLISSLAQKPTGKAQPFNQANTDSSKTDKLYEDLKKVVKDLDKSISEIKQTVKSAADFRSSSRKGAGPKLKDSISFEKQTYEVLKNLSKKSFKNFSETDKVNSVMEKMATAATKKGSIYVHDVHVEKVLKEIKDILENQTGTKAKEKKALILPEEEPITRKKELFPETVPEGPAPVDNKASEERLKHEWQTLEVLNRYQRVLSHVSNTAAKIQETFLGFTMLNKITEDLVKQERQFTQEIRSAGFETMGITKESRTLQHALADIGETTKLTGFSRTESQKAYLSNFKKGLRDQKTAVKLATTQLHTEKMIGLEAGTLADTFSNMSLQMGFSTTEMDSLSRGIRQVARDTGVTGSNLANSIKSSEQFIKNLRNSAQLTVTGAKSIMGLMASAEKFGVGEAYQNLLGTMTQGLYGFSNASSQTQALLAQIASSTGRMNDLYTGKLAQDPKAIAQGIGSILQNVSGGMVDLNTDLDKLDSTTKMYLDTTLRNAYGVGLGELQKSGQAAVENARSLSEKLTEIEKKRNDKSATAQEKKALLEEQSALKTSTSLDLLSRLSQSAKDAGGDMNKALQDFRGSEDWDKISDNLGALKINTTDGKKMTRDLLQTSISSVNEGLKKAGKKGLNISTKDIEKAVHGDGAALREIEDKVSKANQELGVTQKSQTDILSETNQELSELNDLLRVQVGGVMGGFLDSVFGKFGTYAAAALGGFSDIAFKLVSLAVLMQESKMGLTRIFGFAEGKFDGISALWTGFVSNFGVASASTLASIGVAAAAVVAISGAVVGSLNAGEKAAELFGKAQEDLTTAEYYAARGAGAITGALNFLTLGFFDSFLGSTGVITKWLAQFNKMIPILSVVVGIIDAVAGAIWGIILSIKDIVVGAFEMVYLIVKPFGELLYGIGEVVSIILGPLFAFSNKLNETGTIFEVFAKIFGVFGRVLRTIMQAIGFIIGGIFTVIVKVLVPIMKGLAYVISMFTTIIGYVFKTIFDGILGIVQFFEGLFTFDIGKMGQGIWNVISTLFLGIPNLLWNIISGAFTSIPTFVWDAIGGLGTAVKDALWYLVSSIPGALYSALYSAASALGAGWLVERMFGGKKTPVTSPESASPSDQTAKSAKESIKWQRGSAEAMALVAEEGTKKGSLYVHDIYVERQLMALNAMFAFSSIGDSVVSKLSGFFGKMSLPGMALPKLPGSMDLGIVDFISNSFDSLSKPVQSFFSPLTKGFIRAREDGEGLFSAIGRGIKSQYMSFTKGGLLKEGGFLDSQKKKIEEYYKYSKDKTQEYYKWNKDKILGRKADFLKGDMGEKGLLQAGKEKFSDIKDKIFGEKDLMTGVRSEGLLDKAKNKAGSIYGDVKGKAGSFYQGAKDKLFGQKLKEGEFGPVKPGLIDQAKNKASAAYQGAKEKGSSIWSKLTGKGAEGAEKAAEGVDKVTTAGSKMGTMEKVKDGLKNLAEGLKFMSGKDVFFGAMNLIPASVGLVTMIPGYLGASLLSKIDGEKLKVGLTGLATGLKEMASTKVLMGALALVPAGLGFALMIPGMAGMALLSIVGPLAQTGLTALAAGLSSFGAAAMNPMFWLGLAALGAFNIALIPLAYSLSLLSPLVESFGKAIKSVFEGIATVVDSVLGGFTQFISVLSLEKAAGIVAVAGALGLLGVSLLAFSAAMAGGSILSFFGGDGVLDKVLMLSAAGAGLMTAATAMSTLSSSLKEFDTNLDSFLANSDKINQFTDIASKMGTISSVASPQPPTGQADAGQSRGLQEQKAFKQYDRLGNTISSGITLSLFGLGKDLSSAIETIASPATTGISSFDTITTPTSVVANTRSQNLQDSVQRDIVSSEPINKVEAPELGSMLEAENSQTEQLMAAVRLLEQIALSLKPNNSTGSSSADTGDTSTHKIPNKPANYYPWATGHHNQGGTRSLRRT